MFLLYNVWLWLPVVVSRPLASIWQASVVGRVHKAVLHPLLVHICFVVCIVLNQHALPGRRSWPLQRPLPVVANKGFVESANMIEALVSERRTLPYNITSLGMELSQGQSGRVVQNSTYDWYGMAI